MNGRKILYIATTKLITDGLTSVLIRISQIATKEHSVAFALAEGAIPSQIEKLSELGEVFILPSRKRQLPQYMSALYQLIKKEHFDIVHIHGNSATMAFDLVSSKFGGVPVRITHCHNCANQSWLKQKTLGTVCNRLVTLPVACSISSGEMLYRKPFTVLTNGVDCNRFAYSPEKRERIRKELSLNDSFVIGHIGRFTEQKNHGRLLDIFAAVLNKMPNSYLLLCGDGENLERCKEKAAERGIQCRVMFLGNVANPEAIFSAMDVFVLPSLFEGLPLVGIEAQASGLPCVMSDTITKEAAILSTVQFISLEASDETWANTILAVPHSDRAIAAKEVAFAGYDQGVLEDQVRKLYG